MIDYNFNDSKQIYIYLESFLDKKVNVNNVYFLLIKNLKELEQIKGRKIKKIYLNLQKQNNQIIKNIYIHKYTNLVYKHIKLYRIKKEYFNAQVNMKTLTGINKLFDDYNYYIKK